MNIKLPPQQQEWLEAHVAIHSDDLAWAKPYVDQARASVARGDVMSGEEYFKRLNKKLESLRS
jgi:hypothetical protein